MQYSQIKDVPWYRRSMLVGIMAFWGVLATNFVSFYDRFNTELWDWPVLIGILSYLVLLVACIACLTGDIYSHKKDVNGNLKTWGKVNKVLALIFLLYGTHSVYWHIIRHYYIGDEVTCFVILFGLMVFCGVLMRRQKAKK